MGEKRPFRWGMLGTGRHAQRIADGIRLTENAVLYAAASHTPGKGERFCAANGVPRCYASYEQLLRDPEVDGVFVASTNQLHCEHTTLALRCGKPVVCEKPLAINHREAEEMMAAARESGVFLMEAMWSRFFPAAVRLRELLEAGVIGRVQMVSANYGYRIPGYDLSDPTSRIFDPRRGGGSLLDVGVYPLYFASMVLDGAPTGAAGAMSPTPLGVDGHCAAVISFERGAIAAILCGIDGNTDTDACVYGSEGYIRVPRFYHPDTLEIYADGRPVETVRLPFEGAGYQFELMRAQACIEQGWTECPEMPLEESLRLISVLDELRGAWNLRYPFETQETGVSDTEGRKNGGPDENCHSGA